MPDRRPILVVAATARELASGDGWRGHRCGVGPVEAAASTAAAIAATGARAVLHVGIAGARQDAALAPGLLVIGAESCYCDLEMAGDWAPRVALPDATLLAALRAALPMVPVLTIGTSARVGGTLSCHRDVPVEAMEGFGVLRAAQMAGIPAIEIRAVSNEIEEQDRRRWHFDLAFEAIVSATPRLVEVIAACVS